MIELLWLLSVALASLPDPAYHAWKMRYVTFLGIESSLKPLPTELVEAGSPPLRKLDYSLPVDRYVSADMERNRRLYGYPSVELKPEYIVLHFTVIPEASDVLNAFTRPTHLGVGNQEPVTSLVSVHYMVDKDGAVLELVPEWRTTTGTYGLDHKALAIEMVAADEKDLLSRPVQLLATFSLVDGLLKKYKLPVWAVLSHQEVAYGETFLSDYADLADTQYPYFYPKPSFRYDPGRTVMAWCREFLLRRRDMWSMHPASSRKPSGSASSSPSP